MKDYCNHWPGMEYEVTDAEGKSTKRRCKMLLHGAKEAYELSFVAVPAQPRAGTHKSIGFTKPVAEKEETPNETPVVDNATDDTEKMDERIASARIARVSVLF